LLKHSSCYLDVASYENKSELLKLLDIVPDRNSDEYHFLNKGCIRKGKLKFCSRSYSKSDRYTSIYTATVNSENQLIDVIEFIKHVDGRIVARATVLQCCTVRMLDFSNYALHGIPRHLTDLLVTNVFIFVVKHTEEFCEIPVSSLLVPCVTLKGFDSNLGDCMTLVMPCTVISEYN